MTNSVHWWVTRGLGDLVGSPLPVEAMLGLAIRCDDGPAPDLVAEDQYVGGVAATLEGGGVREDLSYRTRFALIKNPYSLDRFDSLVIGQVRTFETACGWFEVRFSWLSRYWDAPAWAPPAWVDEEREEDECCFLEKSFPLSLCDGVVGVAVCEVLMPDGRAHREGQ